MMWVERNDALAKELKSDSALLYYFQMNEEFGILNDKANTYHRLLVRLAHTVSLVNQI